MTVNHSTVKAPGNTLSAADWNAAHTGVIDDTIHGSRGSGLHSDSHARQHAITSTNDHTSAATSGKILKADANGLPVNATNTDAQVSGAVTNSHAKQHALDSTTDHTIGGLTSTYLVKSNGSKLAPATNTDAQVSGAVSASHAKQHALDSTTDHSIGSLTNTYLVKNDGSKLLNASNTDAQVSGAVSASHTRAHAMDSSSDHSAGTQGDIIYATTDGAWAKLAAGTSGYFLKTQGAGANPVWAAPSITNYLKLVSETTVTGDAVGEIDLTSLDLESDKLYVLFMYTTNANASDNSIFCYLNEDTTTSHYTRQRLVANNTTVAAERANDGLVGGTGNVSSNDKTGFFYMQFMKTSGNFTNYFSTGQQTNGGALVLFLATIVTNFTTNVTKINLIAERADGFDVGTKVCLFKQG